MRMIGLVVCLLAPLMAMDNAEVRGRWILEEAIKNKSPETRRHAAAAFGLLPVKDPLAAQLATLVNDPDVPVRLAAVAALSDLAGPAQISLLEGALQDKVPEVAFAAARSLYNLKRPSGREALLAVVEKETKTSSGIISREMRNYMRQLKTPAAAMMLAVREGVGFAPVPGLGFGVNAALTMFADNELTGRAIALLALAADKDPKVQAAARDALSDGDWAVRAAAIHVMAVTNQAALRERINDLLDDKKEQVRFRAAAASIRLAALPVRPPRTVTTPKKK